MQQGAGGVDKKMSREISHIYILAGTLGALKTQYGLWGIWGDTSIRLLL